VCRPWGATDDHSVSTAQVYERREWRVKTGSEWATRLTTTGHRHGCKPRGGGNRWDEFRELGVGDEQIVRSRFSKNTAQNSPNHAIPSKFLSTGRDLASSADRSSGGPHALLSPIKPSGSVPASQEFQRDLRTRRRQ